MSRKTVAAVSVIAFLAFAVCLAAPWTAEASVTKVIAQFKLEKGENSIKFNLTKLADEYSVQITNGDTYGKNRVTSAAITINGVSLFKQSDFSEQVGSLSASLGADALQVGENDLSYKVSSKPGSFLLVSISGVYPEDKMIAYYRDFDGDGFGAPAPVLLLPAGTNPPPAPVMRGAVLYTWVTKGGDCNDYNPLVFPGQGCAPLP